MKIVLFVVAAFAAIQFINCYDFSDDSDETVGQVSVKGIRRQLRERMEIQEMRNKFDSICPGYGNRLENVTLEIQSCALLIDEDAETMCSLIQNHLTRCIRPLTDMLEECLPSQSQKIPSMLVEIVVASVKRLCRSDGEHIFELGNSCIRNTNLKTERCLRRLTVTLQEYKRRGIFPSAQDLCNIVESFRPCLQSHLNTACGNPITRDSYLQIYDEAVSVCKSYEMNEIELV